MRHFGILTILGLPALLAGGCGATVYPPAHPAHPIAVYVADYGHHSSVTLPLGNTAFVEYSFGDWNYMVTNHTAPCDAIQALFFSTSAAFGRRYTFHAIDSTEPTFFGTPKVFTFEVPADCVERVVGDLEFRWQRKIATQFHNSDDDTDFVVDDRRYSWANDCNEMTASILRDLGCKVEGFTYFSAFQLAHE